ncbi:MULTISPECIES: hypothetical protein [Burkholderia]|jgi:hypothetical protein|nr:MULTISPECIES: hypothetical protein [Burkholderia]MDP9545867.1 hypothetical protein [Burkholderia cepacia]MBJ9898972.1 hypothetical protein [Burkholderia cenocepacia]MBJ9918978.1 hypothetical protein [Burkholderia cenocepacia]MBR8271023.1 hypothetical protein [Burkholderia cenocepacia]MBR8369939.1 hypothetical protein [Burkholderia cenocepacia]
MRDQQRSNQNNGIIRARDAGAYRIIDPLFAVTHPLRALLHDLQRSPNRR